MPRAPRVLVVGLDSMDPELILRWSGDGTLSTLRALQQRAAWGPTLNPPRWYNGAAWPSFVTGACPHRHGRYFRYRARPGSFRATGTREGPGQWRPVWETISRAGGRVAVVNVPYAPLGQDLNGVQVVNWAMHDQEFAPLRTWPAGLAADIEARFSDMRTANCDVRRRTTRDFLAFRDRLVAQVAMKARFAEHLLVSADWDLVLTVFDEPHCVGHQCWHHHDPAHPRHDPVLARAVGDPLRDVYVAIDRALGAILAHADPGTACLVLASHGMGPYYDVNLLLDRVLRRLDGVRRGSAGQLLNRLPIAPVGPLAFVPHVGESPWLRLGHRAHDALVTWGRRGRRAFALWPVDEQGRVRFNLAGPGGAREEPASVRAWFADQLRALVDADTGRPLVAEIAAGEPLAAEGYLGDRPDLLVRWAQPSVGAVRSPALGTLEHTYRGSRTGDHRRHGVFFLARPGLVPGRLPDPVPVTDLAPMIAETLGLPPGDLGPPGLPCPVCRRSGP